MSGSSSSRHSVIAVRASVPADSLRPPSHAAVNSTGSAEAEAHWGRRPVASPLARYPGHEVRTVGGPDWPGHFVVEVEADSGEVGVGVSVGGVAACWVVEQHLSHLVVGSDPAALDTIWDQLYRGSLFYGRRGLVMHAISALDLALWDLVGKLSDKPVYELLGGPARETLTFYATTPNAAAARAHGFIGCKLPLAHGLAAGRDGLRRNVERIAEARALVGDEMFLAYDCWMALDVETAVELGRALAPYDVRWLEECLPPDDYWGHRRLRRRLPRGISLSGGEHEATRWGFQALAEIGEVDLLQPDPSWCGGLSEMLKIMDAAEVGGRRVVPHACGAYALHACFARASIPFAECIVVSPDGDKPVPQFGPLFVDEPLPRNGTMELADLGGPGFGLSLNANLELRRPTTVAAGGIGSVV